MILLLDVMSTLVYDPFAVEMPEFLGVSFQEIIARKTPEHWPRFERDEISEEEFYKNFYLEGPPIDGEGLKQVLFDSYRFLDGIEPLLEELSARGVEMHTLSNYPVWWEIIERKLELSRYVEWTFVSCKMGVRKPDPKAYTIPLAALDAAPHECLFVDDRGINCRAAAEVGLHAVKFEGAEALRKSLVEHGVL